MLLTFNHLFFSVFKYFSIKITKKLLTSEMHDIILLEIYFYYGHMFLHFVFSGLYVILNYFFTRN